MDEDAWSNEIIGACIEVHRHLGPGLLESVYADCLARELALRKIPFEKEISRPVEYKGVKLDCRLRLDFVVDGKVVVELKTDDKVLPVHKAQLLTYLKLTGCKLGVIVNFNVPALRHGVRRVVNEL